MQRISQDNKKICWKRGPRAADEEQELHYAKER